MTVFLSIFLFLFAPSVGQALPFNVDLTYPFGKTSSYPAQATDNVNKEKAHKKSHAITEDGIPHSDKIYVQIRKATELYGSGDRQQSLQIINRIEDTVLAREEYYHLSNLLRIKSVIIQQAGFKDEGLRLIDRSIHYGKKIADSDSSHYQIGYALLAKTSMVEEETVRHQLKKAAYKHMSSISNRHPRQQNAMASALTSYATSLMDKKEIDSAEMYLLKALQIFPPDTLYKVSDTFYTLETIGVLYFDSGRYVEAATYFQKALRHNETEQNSYHTSRMYLRLHGAYDRMNKTTEADYYLRQYSIIKDSLDRAKDALINNIAIDRKSEEQFDKPQNKARIRSIVITLLVCISLGVFAWYIGRPFGKRKQYDKDETNPNIFTDIEPAPQSPLAPSQDQLLELYDLAKANNPLFLTKFCSLFTLYVDRLNQLAFPELVSSELEICAYLKLNLDTKEISRYTHRSIRSIENRRHRIRKKLNLPPDSDLKNFLLNLE
ncbi:tetratricopeptide repeat protein [Sphingobacterium pedocola]|uniref:HTH luxR-type domain-containing protein n=1 Tax=Sphingobacterium pedocola TaxID=2082722 RepID=A0ABR9T9Q6_9SPHI|nr:tetratricopeptide repeat protein [Sphingobacterium pedocola]MBE8722084.1 hypothetical protein [Sphingobacterium pedocola]